MWLIKFLERRVCENFFGIYLDLMNFLSGNFYYKNDVGCG